MYFVFHEKCIRMKRYNISHLRFIVSDYLIQDIVRPSAYSSDVIIIVTFKLLVNGTRWKYDVIDVC